MPKKPRIPKYCLHKPSGRARVILDGQHVWLGKYGSDESIERYNRIVAELASSPTDSPSAVVSSALAGVTVVEVLAAYLKHAEAYYQKNGEPTGQLAIVKSSVRPVQRLYGRAAAADFGPMHYHSDHLGGMVAGTGYYGHSVAFGPNSVPGDEGDDDGDGKVEWYKVKDKAEYPDRDELGTGDDIPIATFIDRGKCSKKSTATKKYMALASTNDNRTSIENLSDVENCEIELGNSAAMKCLCANGWVRGRTKVVPKVNSENEQSLCFLVSYGGFDYLVGGDISGRKHGGQDAEVEAAVGEYLAAEGVNIDAVQVNHHGSNNTSASDFLASINAEVAIIAAGNGNEYKHPHFEHLERLADSSVQHIYSMEFGNTVWNDTVLNIKRKNRTNKQRAYVAKLNMIRSVYTAVQGNVIIETDGKTYRVYCPPLELAVDE